MSKCASPRKYGPNTDITTKNGVYYCAESCGDMVPLSYKFSANRKCVEQCPASLKFFNSTTLECSDTCSGRVDMEGRNCSSECSSGSLAYYDEKGVKYCSTCTDKTQALYSPETNLTTLECVTECRDDQILFDKTC